MLRAPFLQLYYIGVWTETAMPSTPRGMIAPMIFLGCSWRPQLRVGAVKLRDLTLAIYRPAHADAARRLFDEAQSTAGMAMIADRQGIVRARDHGVDECRPVSHLAVQCQRNERRWSNVSLSSVA